MDNNNGNGKPYDLTMINAMCDGNTPFLEKLLQVFVDNIAQDTRAIKEAAGEGNWAEVGQLAHKMKSSLAHFKVDSLKDTIRGLEHPGNTDTQTLNTYVADFEIVINDVLTNLKQEFPAVFNK
jgi:HPt (histidine-containing phosphotransfer) domain-containing protein